MQRRRSRDPAALIDAVCQRIDAGVLREHMSRGRRNASDDEAGRREKMERKHRELSGCCELVRKTTQLISQGTVILM